MMQSPHDACKYVGNAICGGRIVAPVGDRAHDARALGADYVGKIMQAHSQHASSSASSH
jgi:hypothetical protein